MKTKTLIPLLSCLFPLLGFSQQTKSVRNYGLDEENYRWEINFQGGLNTRGWEFSGGAHWFPFRYIGIGASLGIDSEIKEFSDWGREDYYEYDYCARFIFKPSLLFRTPSLLHVKSQDMDFHLFASPGMIMSPPARGARNSDWLYWNVATGITAIIDRLTFSIGYSCSNYNLLDGNPYTHHSYDIYTKNTKSYTHSVFIGFGYKF